ncbi:hypothetical protein V1278_006059 [Bradyrhizobium sp. AZCC 1577]
MLARKAAASPRVRQWPPGRMDIPENREDPGSSDRRSFPGRCAAHLSALGGFRRIYVISGGSLRL